MCALPFLSGIQLARDDVVEAVREALTGSGLPGEHLKIELTESAISDNPERTKRVLEALKGLAAQIARDDCGTGYSSLAYLQRLTIDVLERKSVLQGKSGSGRVDQV